MPIYRIFDEVVILDPASVAPAGWTVGNFAAAVNAARINGRSLHIRPGVYDAANVDILPTNGNGRPIRIYGTPGTVTVRFTGGNYCIQIKDVDSVSFTGISFAGQNLAIPAYSAPGAATMTAAGLVVLNNAKQFRFESCSFVDVRKAANEPLDSYKAQLLITKGSRGTVENSNFTNGDVAIWNFSSQVSKYGNKIDGFQSNGIMICDIGSGRNNSIISGNIIENIDALFGNGQTGNSIILFRANYVKIVNNNTSNTKYSGIRCNAASRAIVGQNTIYNARETAIYAEAPGAGLDMIGSIIAQNSIDLCGDGIKVCNSGYYGDGVSRLSVVKGNLISNLVRNSIPAIATAPASLTVAEGISVEQDCIVEGNVIESCSLGLKIGVAQGARDLICDGNVVRNATVGIAFSSNAAASNIVISNNVLRNTPGGAILSTPSLGASPVTATYSASTLSQTAGTGGTVLISSNRAA